MFRRAALTSLAIWVIVIALGTYYFLDVDHKDVEHYERLLEIGEKGPQDQRGKQAKSGVLKEVWIEKEGIPLHIRLESDEALITIERKQNKSQVSEEMSNLVCYMQEAIYPEENTQLVQIIHAEKATYYYRSDSFVADEVEISRYKISGVDLPDTIDAKPLMKAKAKEVEFRLKADGMEIKASKIKAEMDNA